MLYTDLNDIHIPAAGTLVPASWGSAVKDNFDALARQPHLGLSRNWQVGGKIKNDSLTEVPFDTINTSTGDFCSASDGAVSTFTAPRDGYYAASWSGMWVLSTYAATTTIYVALVLNEENFLMRTSSHVAALNSSVGGMVRMSSGDSFTFSAYQTSGADAELTGSARIIYLGGQA